MSLASQLSFLESSTSTIQQINSNFVFAINSAERLRITQNGGVAFGGSANYGTSGQVLRSNGDAAPTWVNVSGFTGFQGSQGITGYQGSQGITGFQGSSGVGGVGFQGSRGFDGSRGATGYQGSVGAGGAGFQGSTGLIGFQGSRGLNGYDGSRGATGYQGSVGLIGFQGSRGLTGYDGSRGALGYQGSAGSQINTVAQPVNAIYYPTFVDANNASATPESLYTTSSFSVNPSIRQVSINGSVIQGGSSAQGVDLVLRGGTGASSEGPQIVMGYGNNTTSAIVGQANRTWNIDVASGAANNNFRIFRVNSVGASAVAVEITESNGGIQLLSLGVGTAPSGTTGEIRATNEVTAYYSDRRLKENIKPIDNAVEKVSKLNGITYTPNDLARSFGYISNRTIVGLFADEVDVVLPEAVRPAPFDQDENGNSKSGENYQTIQYEKLVPLLVEAIKEQQKQIDQLFEMVNKLINK